MPESISPEARQLVERIVPPPYRPPRLYLELARNPAVVRAFVEGPIAGLRGLMHTGQLAPGASRQLSFVKVEPPRPPGITFTLGVSHYCPGGRWDGKQCVSNSSSKPSGK